MDGQVWRQLAGETGQANVLDNQGIDASLGGLQHQLPGSHKLAWKQQHVHREEATHAAPVQPIHHLGEVGGAEVFSPQPGVKHLHAEIDRIGPIGDGGPEGLPAACRGEQFRRQGKGWGKGVRWSPRGAGESGDLGD